MTVSILNDILILYRASPDTTKIEDYFRQINVLIFSDIFATSQKRYEANQKIAYILSAYSEDSPMIVLRQDSKVEKENICEYLQIPEFLRKELMDLKDPKVRAATIDYLNAFAGPTFRTLMFLKIQQEFLEQVITRRELSIPKVEEDAEGNKFTQYYFDFKEYGKAVTEHARIAKQIDMLEKGMKQQIKQMEGIEDMRSFQRGDKEGTKRKVNRTGNVENVINQTGR